MVAGYDVLLLIYWCFVINHLELNYIVTCISNLTTTYVFHQA